MVARWFENTESKQINFEISGVVVGSGSIVLMNKYFADVLW